MHFGLLCIQLRAPISFFLLFGTNSSPQKVQHLLVSPNSIKLAPKGLFFGAPTGSEVVLCWGRCTKISTFLRDPPHPSQNRNFHLIYKIADFLQNKRFCLIALKDLHFLGLWGVFLVHLTTRNTFFSLWECHKMGFFSKDRTYRVFFVVFNKKNFFRMVPKGLNAFWTSVHPAERANYLFSAFWN